MTKKILIAGGSGLIGRHLTDRLLEKGYTVAHLGRTGGDGKVRTFVWDPEAGTYDVSALQGVDVVINFAGAGVADKRWSSARKKIIRDSRIKSVKLLSKMVEGSSVKTILGASAIGYYGFSDYQVFEESNPAGSDFLAHVTNDWENEYAALYHQGKRVVTFRIGIVLARDGGALQEMAKPVRYFVGAPLGKGTQMMSWIHIDDLCSMFMQAIEQEDMSGVYNAVSPSPLSNKEMTRAIAKTLSRPILVPFVPAFMLNIIFGEMAMIILKGSIVSSKKISATGFKFSFEEISLALQDLLGSRT